MWIVIGISILALFLIIAVWWIKTSNDFKRKQIKVDEAQSGIEVALTKRFDKLTKMRDIAKSYASHERDLFAQVISMRKGMTIGELNETCSQMNALATRINAVAEAYPELRSADVFRELQAGIRDSEAHLQAARRLYNSNVTAYNTAIVVFPSSIVAGSQGLSKADFFTADETKTADVQMSM